MVTLRNLASAQSTLTQTVIIDDRRDYPCFQWFSMGSETEAFNPRVLATIFIFAVSLSAVSFPTLSKRISYLRIPRIIFFIGKHFGTGVILSTAFVHLLQDSFEALRSPLVRARWNVGDHVGLIVLCSMLAIFIVEYVSTSYVHQLHSYSSPPSSTATTPRNESTIDIEHASLSKFTDAQSSNSEETPLVRTADSLINHSHGQNASYGTVPYRASSHDIASGDASTYFEGHHRHESRSSHKSHHERSRPTAMYGPPESAQVQSSLLGHHHHAEHGTDIHEHHHSHHHHHLGREDDVKIGKKRQIVGILVLQLGIMIHSLVIGLTLSITSGPDFATLLTALIFHQLFEGLSLGIRIATLPSPQESEFKHLSMLKPTLACLFAITTPAGILLGILIFAHNDDMAHLRLTQGIMSAVSAGMLTYAACVEMLAGDFVMDPNLWQSGVWKQALALFSLAAGVTAMALVGS